VPLLSLPPRGVRAGGVAREETTFVAHESRRCCLASPAERGEIAGLLASAEMASAAEGTTAEGCEEEEEGGGGGFAFQERMGGAGGVTSPLPLSKELCPLPSSNSLEEKEAALAVP